MRRDEAACALARIGPPAVDFAAVFFEELDAEQATNLFEGAWALGSIGRDDPDVIDGLLRRLRSGPVAIRSARPRRSSTPGRRWPAGLKSRSTCCSGRPISRNSCVPQSRPWPRSAVTASWPSGAFSKLVEPARRGGGPIKISPTTLTTR